MGMMTSIWHHTLDARQERIETRFRGGPTSVRSKGEHCLICLKSLRKNFFLLLMCRDRHYKVSSSTHQELIGTLTIFAVRETGRGPEGREGIALEYPEMHKYRR